MKKVLYSHARRRRPSHFRVLTVRSVKSIMACSVAEVPPLSPAPLCRPSLWPPPTVARVLLLALSIFSLPAAVEAIGEVVYAVNCGGPPHVDVYGVEYSGDPLAVGFASDHGKNLAIRRVPPPDQILYQTERYHLADFAYDVPIRKDGDYVLVLKFSEVWFTESNQKVRDSSKTLICEEGNHLAWWARSGLLLRGRSWV